MSKKFPELRDDFNEKLESFISKCNSRDMLFLLGDYNTITGSGQKDFLENIGKFGKGKVNENVHHAWHM